MMQQKPDLIAAARRATANMSDSDVLDILSNPVILLSAPRSGSTLLFEQLSRQAPLWTIGGESHAIFRAFPGLRAEDAELSSMALGEAHADPETCGLMRRCFLYFLRNSQGVPFLALPRQDRPAHVCLLEKTPRNALNIAFLLKVFPAARFLYLHRDARQTVSSLIEAWTTGLQTGRFVTFRDLPNWPLPGWCFLLPRGWQKLRGRPLAEIAAFQWSASNDAIIDGLSELEENRHTTVDYSELVADPAAVVSCILKSFGFAPDATSLPSGILPLSRTTLSPPHAEKWKRYEKEIEVLAPALAQTEARIKAFCAGGK